VSLSRPLVLVTLVALGACGGHPLATDPGAAGGAAGATGATGATGAGSATGAAAVGAAGAMGAAGGLGDAGALAPPPRALPIPADQALNRIAAVLWRAAPDDALVAASGSIRTADDLAMTVGAMVEDPRARAGVGAFYRWWLGLDRLATSDLDKSPMIFPEDTPQLRADMARETETFGVNVTTEPGYTFTSLMTLPQSWFMPDVAPIYGVIPTRADDSLRVALPPSERAGLLTQPALQALGSLANRTSPSRRGTEIARRFFCQTVPAAPPNISGLDPIPPGTSVRQALNMSIQSASCSACHALFDPLGLPFEAFDAIGRARSTDNGVPVDPTAADVPELARGGVAVGVDGPVELATKMAGDASVQSCFARKWLEFALGREIASPNDPDLAAIVAAWSSTGFNNQALVVDVLTSDTFLAPAN